MQRQSIAPLTFTSVVVLHAPILLAEPKGFKAAKRADDARPLRHIFRQFRNQQVGQRLAHAAAFSWIVIQENSGRRQKIEFLKKRFTFAALSSQLMRCADKLGFLQKHVWVGAKGC